VLAQAGSKTAVVTPKEAGKTPMPRASQQDLRGFFTPGGSAGNPAPVMPPPKSHLSRSAPAKTVTEVSRKATSSVASARMKTTLGERVTWDDGDDDGVLSPERRPAKRLRADIAVAPPQQRLSAIEAGIARTVSPVRRPAPACRKAAQDQVYLPNPFEDEEVPDVCVIQDGVLTTYAVLANALSTERAEHLALGRRRRRRDCVAAASASTTAIADADARATCPRRTPHILAAPSILDERGPHLFPRRHSP
jgi:hypothetical protein